MTRRIRHRRPAPGPLDRAAKPRRLPLDSLRDAIGESKYCRLGPSLPVGGIPLLMKLVPPKMDAGGRDIVRCAHLTGGVNWSPWRRRNAYLPSRVDQSRPQVFRRALRGQAVEYGRPRVRHECSATLRWQRTFSNVFRNLSAPEPDRARANAFPPICFDAHSVQLGRYRRIGFLRRITNFAQLFDQIRDRANKLLPQMRC